MLALSDSQIPLVSNFASVCLLLSQKGEVLPDPCKEEEDVNVGAVAGFNCRIQAWLQLLIMKRVRF